MDKAKFLLFIMLHTMCDHNIMSHAFVYYNAREIRNGIRKCYCCVHEFGG